MLSERMTVYTILAISSEFTLTIDTYLRFEELNEIWRGTRLTVAIFTGIIYQQQKELNLLRQNVNG